MSAAPVGTQLARPSTRPSLATDAKRNRVQSLSALLQRPPPQPAELPRVAVDTVNSISLAPLDNSRPTLPHSISHKDFCYVDFPSQLHKFGTLYSCHPQCSKRRHVQDASLPHLLSVTILGTRASALFPDLNHVKYRPLHYITIHHTCTSRS